MKNYSDISMDFADATLVSMAEDMGIRQIATLDRKGFTAFHLHGKEPSVLLL